MVSRIFFRSLVLLKLEVVYFYVFIYLFILSYNGLSKSTLQGIVLIKFQKEKKSKRKMLMIYLHHDIRSITSRCLGKWARAVRR